MDVWIGGIILKVLKWDFYIPISEDNNSKRSRREIAKDVMDCRILGSMGIKRIISNCTVEILLYALKGQKLLA